MRAMSVSLERDSIYGPQKRINNSINAVIREHIWKVIWTRSGSASVFPLNHIRLHLSVSTFLYDAMLEEMRVMRRRLNLTGVQNRL